MTEVKAPLTNLQMELLKAFSREIPEQDLHELRIVISKFLLEKSRSQVDKIGIEKGYTDETIKKWLDEE